MALETLRQVELGDSGISASVIGFGTYHLREKIGAHAAIDAMAEAFDAGVTLFDTSDNYGTEELIGLAIREGVIPREEVVITTKTGLATCAQEHLRWSAEGKRRDTSPSRIRSQVDASLRLFGDGVETIDVYQLHVYDSEVPVEEYPWLMNELIYAGKIRAYGVSNYPAEALQELLAACDRDALPRPVTSQPFLNIVQGVQDTEHLAQSEGMTTLAHSPLLKGLLVDGMVDDLTQMTQGNSLPEVQGFKQGLDGLKQLQGYAKERELTLAQLAIAWVTSQPNTIALSACTSERYLTDAITGASHQLDLEDEELKVICKSFDDLNFVNQAVQIMKQMKIYYR